MKAVKYKKILKALRQSIATLNLEEMPVDRIDYQLVKRNIIKKTMEMKKWKTIGSRTL